MTWSISTSTSWDGFALESTYLGSGRAGYRGTHLVLGRAGHRFCDATHLEPALSTAWWRRALLDHFAVLQTQLADSLGLDVRIEIGDAELADLRV